MQPQNNFAQVPVPAAQPIIDQQNSKKSLNKKLIFIVLVVLAVLIAGITIIIFTLGKLGASVDFAEGTVEYRASASANWLQAASGQSLKESNEIRTLDNSRAVVKVEDGSLIRLNSNSSMALKKLASDQVIIENTGGEAYARVVDVEKRKFEVVVKNAAYRSGSTAYMTINTDTRQGVQVYHNKVAVVGVNGGDISIEQGQSYYQLNKDTPANEGKVAEIPKEEVATDSFIKWNVDQDKLGFQNELGMLYLEPPALEVSEPANGFTTDKALVVVKGTTDPDTTVLINDANATNNKGVFEVAVALAGGGNIIKVESFDTAGNRTVKTITVNRTGATPVSSTPTNKINLSGIKLDSGLKLNWIVTGYTADKGFMLVTATTSKPTYPADKATFIEPGAATYTWKIGDGETHYFRLCVYDGSACANYSNIVRLVAPNY